MSSGEIAAAVCDISLPLNRRVKGLSTLCSLINSSFGIFLPKSMAASFRKALSFESKSFRNEYAEVTSFAALPRSNLTVDLTKADTSST